MRHTAQRRRFPRRYAARAKVVQLEGQLACDIVRGLFQPRADDRLALPAQRGDRGGIPDGAQQRGLDEGRQPRHTRIGVLDLHQRHTGGHDHPFGQRFDLNRQKSPMISNNRIPAGAIERHAMGGADRLGFIDIGAGDGLAQIVDQEGLQPKEQRFFRKAIVARFGIGADRARFGRILQEMAVFIAVSGKDQIGHDVNASHFG